MFYEEVINSTSQKSSAEIEADNNTFNLTKPDDVTLTDIPLESKSSDSSNNNYNQFARKTDVTELKLYSQKKPDKVITMPSVEDGLSSDSEISNASISCDANKLPSTNEDIILTSTNNTVLKDISRDIQELRLTLNSKNSSNSAESTNCSQKQKSEYQKKEYESDEDTDKLLTKPYEHNPHKIDIPELRHGNNQLECERRRRGKEVAVRHPDYPTILIEGLIFRANYLGSTQLMCESKLSRDSRMLQAQEAVGRVKAPDSESQPSVAVELFISTEKILVLNTNLTEIMMDHSLKTISYIADIGNILVLMARRINTNPSPSGNAESDVTSPSTATNTSPQNNTTGTSSSSSANYHQQNKIICHVFESEEAQLIAQTIGNAFQVAYIEFLKANGIDDPKLFKDVDYQDVLNDQQIPGDELKLFASSEEQKEVVIPKQKGELMGLVIVESGWGSMIPTVVIANMNPSGPAARCGSLNIGNQIISVNGTSLVGLPLINCQQIIKKTKNQTTVKLVVISCPPVVEVNIRRPDPKYQLGFSVQNGVICSLLRGGIAERGGIRVGHHIIEINGISVVAMSHEKIVNILATSFGEIHIRTMPSSIFRLLTGQETPNYI